MLLCLMAVAAWAGVRVVVFVPQDAVGLTPSQSPYAIEKDCVMLEVSNGLVNETQFRVYKGQSLTISVCYGNIISIELYCTGEGDAQYGPGCFEQSVGDYAYQEKIGVWTGCAPQVSFIAKTNQVRMTKIVVTVDDGDGLCAPIISPASGTYYAPFEATITSYTTGAAIHYTTDGSDPDAQSPVYTAPIVVDHNMTIKAVAILDGEMSDVVSADYAIASLPSFNCFEDLEPLDDNTEVRFTSPIYAVAQTNRYLFVKDGCGGYALIYGDVGQTYHTGDVIPAGFVVTRTTYSGEMELINPAGFRPATGSIPIEPEQITLDQVGHDLFAHYVILEDVSIIEEDGTYYAVDASGNRIPMYFNRFNCPVPPDLTRRYNIIAIIGSYGRENVIYQLLPIRVTFINQRIGLGNYWQFYNPENPNPYEITFDYDATVILQSSNYLYAKDETGYGLIFGNVGQTYKHGDVIPAGFGGKVTYYDGWPELTQPLSGFQPPIAQVEVVPEEVTIPQVGPALWAHYVIIKNVIVDKEKGVIRDENGNELPIYIRPGLPFTYPDETDRIDIRGIVTAYKGNFQLLVWDFGDQDPKPVHCLQDAYNLENPDAPFMIKLVVIYQNGVNLYAQDLCEDYILMYMYGFIDGEFINGDTIEGLARLATYQNQRQLVPVGDWVKVGHGLPVEPEDAGCTEEVSQDMCHWYVRFENVKFVTEGGNTYIEDECGLLLMYNKFSIEIPGPELPIAPPRNPYDLNNDGEVNIADINCLIDMILSGKIDYDWIWTQEDDGEMKWNVSGFLTVYRNQLEFYPVEITSAGGVFHIIGDLNDDGELNIADLNVLIDKIIANV